MHFDINFFSCYLRFFDCTVMMMWLINELCHIQLNLISKIREVKISFIQIMILIYQLDFTLWNA